MFIQYVSYLNRKTTKKCSKDSAVRFSKVSFVVDGKLVHVFTSLFYLYKGYQVYLLSPVIILSVTQIP